MEEATQSFLGPPSLYLLGLGGFIVVLKRLLEQGRMRAVQS